MGALAEQLDEPFVELIRCPGSSMVIKLPAGSKARLRQGCGGSRRSASRVGGQDPAYVLPWTRLNRRAQL